jgi:cyclopropane fatty-acyl-phospholipid synthase-like methyltransferase
MDKPIEPDVRNFPFESPEAWALRHVAGGNIGTPIASGQFQFEMLKREGLQPGHLVLEIGAGCLLLGHHLIAYLKPWHYVAIEPEARLIPAGKRIFNVQNDFHFTDVKTFHAGRDVLFDYIYSHSVLSHASASQLDEYMYACSKQLQDSGKAFASYRIGATNTNSDRWLYPGNTYFTPKTMELTAQKHGLQLIHRPDIRTAFMEATAGEHHHDWVELTH